METAEHAGHFKSSNCPRPVLHHAHVCGHLSPARLHSQQQPLFGYPVDPGMSWEDRPREALDPSSGPLG
jgi:hypothetical protein